MADNKFKLGLSYQENLLWCIEQISKGTVDVEELTEQVETNKGDIEDLQETDTSLDERITALEEAPAPTGGLEIINVSVGEASEMGEGYYELVISPEDKAKVLANPQNYVLVFAENHVGTAYAHFIGSMSAELMGMNENVYDFTFLGTFPSIYDIQLFVGDIDIYFEKRYETIDANDVPYVIGKTIETSPGGSSDLNLTSDQIAEIYNTADVEQITLKVIDASYTVYLHYDGFANNTVFFSGTKPVSGGTGKATFTIVNVMGTLTQHYNY